MRFVGLGLAIGCLVVAGISGYRFYDSFQRLPGTEIPIPGSRSISLERGTYRIYVRNYLLNGNQCRPKDHRAEMERMGLRLRPERGSSLEPRLSGSCDGGSKDQTFTPGSVAEFRVERGGRYRLTGERPPGMTAYQRPARVYLVNSTGRFTSLLAGIGAILVLAIVVPLLLRRR